MLKLITVLAGTLLLPATGNAAPALYDTLLYYMAERYENRIELEATVDRDVTDDICSLVTAELLGEMHRTNPGNIKTGLAAPLLGVPPNSTYWSIQRAAPGWFNATMVSLVILTNNDYCRASYFINTF